MRSRWFSMCALPLLACAVLFACSDDALDPVTTPGTGPDATSPPGPDSSPAVDAAPTQDVVEGGALVDVVDGATDADAEASAPTITATLGSTGIVRVMNDSVLAEFSEDDTIVRAANAPECVLHAKSATKPYSPAGNLTVGGSIVGTPGATNKTLVIKPSVPQGYYYFGGDVYGPNDALFAQLELAGTPSFTPLPVQTLRTPPTAMVTVQKPPVDLNVTVEMVPSQQGYPLQWTPLAGANPDHRLLFGLWGVIGSTGKRASLYCSYPLSQGQATVPHNLLAEMKARVGNATFEGRIHILAGAFKEIGTGGASYVIEVSHLNTTDYAEIDAELK